MPRWSLDGRQLFYWTDEAMMVIAVETTPTFIHGIPKVFLQRTPVFVGSLGVLGIAWDIHPNDGRFLMIKPPEITEEESQRIIVVTNWLEELKRKVPVE